MKIAIVGYGNLGNGIEVAMNMRQPPNGELIGVFVRRDPATVKTCTGVPVYSVTDIVKFKDRIDALILCSHHSATPSMLDFAVTHHLPVVLATTGHTDEEEVAIRKAAESIPVFFTANFSLGVALLIDTARRIAAAMPNAQIEINEKHHDRKLDAPSGTALAIANALCEVRPEATVVTGRSGYGKRTPEEIGVHAIRMGNIVGEHEVIIGTPNQTITLKHEAHDRALFAEGALAAAEFLCKGLPAGLYDMTDLVSKA